MPLRLDIKRRLTARFDLCFLSNWRICLKSSLHHSTSPIVQVRPSEVLRPSSYWTVDARVSLQWQRSHLELREPAACQVVWGGRPFSTWVGLGFIFSLAGLRSSSQSGGFCTKEELGRHWFWWYAGWYYFYVHILTNPDFLDPYFQLQHAGETACLWSALRLCQKYCCPPNSGLPWLFTVLTVYC